MMYIMPGKTVNCLREEKEKAVVILIKSIIINTKNLTINLKTVTKKQKTINSRGEISRFNYCDSKFHWVNNCPDLPEPSENNF